MTITGGARGIGLATAAALIAQGAKVAIGDLDGAPGAAAELGGDALGLPLDVTSRESFTRFLDQAERRFGPVDVFINNAGIMPLGPFVDERDELTARVIDVNLVGVMLGCKLALERLLQRDSGHIVNVASSGGKIGLPGGATYSATKFAVVGLSEAIRAELAGTRVELHLVMPAPVATEMAAGERKLRGIRQLEPSDVAQAIVDALRYGHADVYLPRVLGPLLRGAPALPRPLAERLGRLIGSHRVLAGADPLARAAYEAKIAPAPRDAAATVASAAASVADAVGDN